MTSHQLFRFNGKEVPVDQAGQIKEHFANGKSVHLQWKAPRCPHTALDSFRQLTEVQVAGIGFPPSVHDADDRLGYIDIRVTHRLQQGTAQQFLSVMRMFPVI